MGTIFLKNTHNRNNDCYIIFIVKSYKYLIEGFESSRVRHKKIQKANSYWLFFIFYLLPTKYSSSFSKFISKSSSGIQLFPNSTS